MKQLIKGYSHSIEDTHVQVGQVCLSSFEISSDSFPLFFKQKCCIFFFLIISCSLYLQSFSFIVFPPELCLFKAQCDFGGGRVHCSEFVFDVNSKTSCPCRWVRGGKVKNVLSISLCDHKQRVLCFLLQVFLCASCIKETCLWVNYRQRNTFLAVPVFHTLAFATL